MSIILHLSSLFRLLQLLGLRRTRVCFLCLFNCKFDNFISSPIENADISWDIADNFCTHSNKRLRTPFVSCLIVIYNLQTATSTGRQQQAPTQTTTAATTTITMQLLQLKKNRPKRSSAFFNITACDFASADNDVNLSAKC